MKGLMAFVTIAGRHAVYHALKARRRKVSRLILQKGIGEKGLGPILTEAASLGIPIERGEIKVNIEVHQGVAAEVSEPLFLDLQEVISSSAKRERSRLLVLDGIEDPRNLGALLRSALSFGIDGVILPRHRSAPLTAVAVKAAAGAVEYLSFHIATNITQAIGELKESGFWVYGSVTSGGKDPFLEKFPRLSALVIGGEAKGVTRLVRERCDILLTIPCTGQVGSLNASVAGGILMSCFTRPPVVRGMNVTPQNCCQNCLTNF